MSSRPNQDDVVSVGDMEAPQGQAQELVRPSCGSVRQNTSDSPSQGHLYQLQPCEKKKPQTLLDLPTDVLHIIIYEVSRFTHLSIKALIASKLTHTNDLTALALTNSALHRLVTPYIYARFDIVWPDGQGSSDQRSGVDALTFGLGTLVMREDLYNPILQVENEGQKASTHEYICNHCNKVNVVQSASSSAPNPPLQVPRIGNHYSQYVKKFSLGNGPTDWVREYLITKEGGKMLGTLVALALARMPNLESFVWDMPTGILREIWQSLSYTSRTAESKRSRLEKLSIRLHDNREVLDVSDPPPKIPPVTLSSNPWQTPSKTAPSLLEWSYKHIEHPSFSICPPLKSLTVMNIDELAYWVELSILVKKSLSCMRELRLSMAHLGGKMWSSSSAHKDYKFSSYPEISFIAHGSFLGLLMSGFYDCRKEEHETQATPIEQSSAHPQTETISPPPVPADSENQGSSSESAVGAESLNGEAEIEATTETPADDCEISSILDESQVLEQTSPETLGLDVPCIESASKALVWNTAETPAPPLPPVASGAPVKVIPEKQGSPKPTDADHQAQSSTLSSLPHQPESLSRAEQDSCQMLKLRVLALEKIPIAESVLVKSIDMTKLTHLTILQCHSHERLWRILRRKFAPHPVMSIKQSPASPTSSSVPSGRVSAKSGPIGPPSYQLCLTHIRTDAVSPPLISFIKETLAPNTLQHLFLQRRNSFYESSVTTTNIYRGAIRPHRLSLTKLLIDSSELGPVPRTTIDRSWKKWQLDREILQFITTPGKVPKLREFGFCVSYKDWVLFLQRLPHLPQLRSLYIPHIDDDECRHRLDGKDLAAMVVDLVISLRPEIELAMMGLLGKCFEVLEGATEDKDADVIGNGEAVTGPGDAPDNEADDLDDDDDGASDDDGENQPPANSTPADAPIVAAEQEESDLTDSELSDTEEIDPVTGSAKVKGKGKEKEAPTFRLREILFYDKIAIFKARHGRL